MDQWQITDEAAIAPELDEAIKEGLCTAFPADVAVYSQVRAWHDSWPSYTLSLRDGGTVAAHIAVIDRTVRIGGSVSVRVAGLQNVYALPQYRGRGLAAQGLGLAMDEARRRGFDFGLLFCIPPLEKVYGPLGWLSAGERDIIRVDEGEEKPLPAKNICMYLPLSERPFPDGAIHLCGNDW